jgi:hypothetical protein
VTWRDGVHLTATPIWCDARRRRDVCFVSSADRVGRAGHGQLIGSPLTLALLGARGGGHLGVPLHRRFTLGTVRLELVASGRGPGAAALHVDHAGKSVLYAGAVRPLHGPRVAAIAVAEARTSHAVVVAAPYGEDRHRFPPLGDVIAQTLEWVRAQLATGRRPVLLVDTALDGLEVATCLHAAGIATAGARAIRDLARRAGELAAEGVTIEERSNPARAVVDRDPQITPLASRPGELVITAPGREPRTVVWLAADRGGLARALVDRPHTTALVSGRALEGRGTCDAGFVWANAAGRTQLLEWIETTSAREVFVTGAGAEAIAGALGPRARIIGPPHQMTLFPREAIT